MTGRMRSAESKTTLSPPSPPPLETLAKKLGEIFVPSRDDWQFNRFKKKLVT